MALFAIGCLPFIIEYTLSLYDRKSLSVLMAFLEQLNHFFCRRRCHRRHHRRQPVYWQKAQRHHQQIIALSHIHMFAQSNCQPVKVNFRFQFLRFSQIQTNFFPSIRFRNLCRVKIDKKL